MTNRFLHFLLSGMACFATFGQSKKVIDSLQKQLNKDPSSIDKVNIYLNLADQFSISDSTLTVQYAEKAMELSRAIDYFEGEVEAKNCQGAASVKAGDYENAKQLYNEVLASSKKYGYLRGESKGYIGLGNVAIFLGNYQESVELINESLPLSTKNGDKDLVARAYFHLGKSYTIQGEYEKAEEYLSKSVLIYEALGLGKETAKSYNGLGVLYHKKGNYDSALNFFLSSLKIHKQDNATYSVSSTLTNIANVYRYKGDYLKSLDYFFQSVTLSSKFGYKEILAACNNNIGLVYAELGDQRKALEYYQKSLVISEALNYKHAMQMSYGNIGTSYKELRELNYALEYHKKSMTISEETGDKWGMGEAYNLLGGVYLELGPYDTAFNYFQHSFQIYEEIGADVEKISPLIGLGQTYSKISDFSSARKILRDALDRSKESGRINFIKDSAKELSYVEKMLGNHETALDTYVLYKQIEDSITNENKTKEITRLEVEFEFQHEKDSINFANAALQLALENNIQKRKVSQQTFLIALTFLTILLIVLIFFYRLKIRTTSSLASLNEEIKSQNLSLEGKKKELEYANKSKSRFFSIIAHDLRDPLNAISSFNKILNEHLTTKYDVSGDSRFGVLLWHFENSIGQVSSLLNQLLTWAIKDEGLLQYHPENVNLNHTFEENNEIYQPLAKTKNISLKYKVEESLFAFVDKSSFMTILRNLTSNALKFTPEGGEVKIAAKKPKDRILLTVKDNGIGISTDKLKNIFELDDSKLSADARGKKGPGLGLMLVHDLVKMNKGTIEVKSEVDKGTSFIVSLPSMQSF